MISHELRTPLHAIVSSVELLGLNARGDADRKIMQRLETGARHLEAQMRDLTDYARLGAGKLELRMSGVRSGRAARLDRRCEHAGRDREGARIARRLSPASAGRSNPTRIACGRS